MPLTPRRPAGQTTSTVQATVPPAVERAVTLEGADDGRLDMRPLPTGEPWGDYEVSTARWTGALLHDVLKQAQPATNDVDVRFEGADDGPTTSTRSSSTPTRATCAPCRFRSPPTLPPRS